jgi:hypothetical protein
MRHLAYVWFALLTASGIASAQISTVPGSLDFGGQSMATSSAPQAVTVTNNGAGTVTISAVSVGDPQFSQSNTCTTVAPGASCTVTVTFTPAIVAGDLNATFPVSSSLTVTSNAPGSPNQVPLSGVAERSLVTHYYRSILRRAPDAGGKAFWQKDTLRMAGLETNVNEAWFAMAQFFYFSAEYKAFNRDDTGFVTDLYNTFFNRAPDSGGLAFWLDQISQGMPREVVLTSFMFSQEFRDFTASIFGNPSVRKEVDLVMDMYRGLLSRLPEDAALASLAERIRAEQCKAAPDVMPIASEMFLFTIGTPEYTDKQRTNAQFVGDLYNTYLRRGGDLQGVQFYVNSLNSGALNRYQVGNIFLNSAEFKARADAVEAEGCVSRGTTALLGQPNGDMQPTDILSMAAVSFGGDGLPIVVSGAFKVSRCADALCATGLQQTTLDALFLQRPVGRPGTGLDGLPFIGYAAPSQYQGPPSLHTAKCGASNCSGLNTYSFLQGQGFTRSEFSMLDGASTTDDKALFVYSAPSLTIEKCADAACNTTTRTGLGPGYRAGVVARAGGLPLIAYEAPGAGIRLVTCGNPTCTSGNSVSTVDPENSTQIDWPATIETIAVALGVDGFPVLAYSVRYNPSNSSAVYTSFTRRAMKVAKCGDAQCSTGNVVTEIDQSLDGGWVSIVVPPDGRPVVSYRTSLDATLKIVRCGNAACTSGNTVTTLPGIGHPVSSVQMTLGPTGKPFFAMTQGSALRTFACNAVDCR